MNKYFTTCTFALLLTAYLFMSMQAVAQSTTQPSTQPAFPTTQPMDPEVKKAALLRAKKVAALEKSIFAFEPQQPKDFPVIVKGMRDTQLLSSPQHASFCMGFLIGNFKKHPNLISQWLKEENTWHVRDRQVIIGSLWLAETITGDAFLKGISEQEKDALAPSVKQMLKQKRGVLSTLSYTQPQTIHLTWGMYFATRDIKLLDKMLLVIDQARTNKTLQQVMTLGLIRQSITQYAWHDARFYRALVAYETLKPNKAVADIIQQIDNTRAKLTTQPAEIN